MSLPLDIATVARMHLQIRLAEPGDAVILDGELVVWNKSRGVQTQSIHLLACRYGWLSLVMLLFCR
jgi:hypothetical protein